MLVNSIQACIQNVFKDYIDQEKGYPNCSTPWNEDMLKCIETNISEDILHFALDLQHDNKRNLNTTRTICSARQHEKYKLAQFN